MPLPCKGHRYAPFECGNALREKISKIAVELCVKRVDGNVDRAAVCLEAKDLPHDVGRRPPQPLAVGVKVLQVRLVQRVTNHLRTIAASHQLAPHTTKRLVATHLPLTASSTLPCSVPHRLRKLEAIWPI